MAANKRFAKVTWYISVFAVVMTLMIPWLYDFETAATVLWMTGVAALVAASYAIQRMMTNRDR